MGGFRLAVGRVSLVHTLCYCQHRARGRRARLDAGGQRMPCKFSSPSHPVLLSARGPGGAEHVEVQEAGGGAPPVAWICFTPLSRSKTAELSPPAVPSPQVTTDSSAQNRSTCPISGLNLLYAAELISNCRAVTTKDFIAPGNDRSISQNRSKCRKTRLDLLHSPELILNCRAVTTKACMPPGNDCAISMAPQGKGLCCCCQLWLKYQSCKALSVLYLCCF